MLTFLEKLIIMTKRRNMSLTDLAEKTYKIPIDPKTKKPKKSSNLSNKIKRNDFRESEMRKLADGLNCDLIIIFKQRDTGEEF